MTEKPGPVQLILDCPDGIRLATVMAEAQALESRGRTIRTAEFIPTLPTLRLVWTNDPGSLPPAPVVPADVTIAVIHRRSVDLDIEPDGYDAILVDDQVDVTTLLPWAGVAALRRQTRRDQPSATPPSPVASALSAALPQRFEGRVLVADDALSTREFLRVALTAAGAEVIVAKDGIEALSLAEGEKLDLILMDVEMPGMNGPDVMSRLRAGGVTIPIVALTGHLDDEQRRRCEGAGASAFLTKDHTKSELLSAISRYLPRAAGSERADGDPSGIAPALAGPSLRFLERLDAAVSDARTAADSGDWRALQKVIHPLVSGTMFGYPEVSASVREIAESLRTVHAAHAAVREKVARLRELNDSYPDERRRLKGMAGHEAPPDAK